MKPKNLHSNIANVANGVLRQKETLFPFYLIVLYLFLEYGRPQNLVPILSYLHLPAITVLSIGMYLFFSGKLYLKDKQTILFLLLMSEMLIHGPIALNNYWAFQMFYTMTITFIVYVGIVNIVDKDFLFEKLIKFWLITFIFLSVIGYMHKGKGVGGFIGDENDFCLAINMVLPVALFGVFSAKNKIDKIYYVFLTCLFLFVVVLTSSRGGFVGLVAVAIYCWFRSNKKMVLAFLMAVLVIFILVIAPPSYWEEIRSISQETSDTQGTGAQRFYHWKLGWHMFVENPILGVGQGNYPWNAGLVEEELGVLWRTRSLAGRAAHSLYFTLLPELGLTGVIIFASMIYFTLKDLKYIKRMARKKDSNLSKNESNRFYFLALAFEGSLVAYLVSGIFVSVLYYPHIWILFGFVLSLKKILNEKFNNVIKMPAVA